MFQSKEQFKLIFLQKLQMMYGKRFEDTTVSEQYHALGQLVREQISAQWIETNEKHRTCKRKQVYYLSIEFLLGRMLGNNLLNLGIRDLCEEALREIGISLVELEECEIDAGLGNGGLGRLAACFLDSLASLNLPGHGCGIRYKHGLFDQKIVNGYQVELPEQWLTHGNVWEVRRADEAVDVKFWGEVEAYRENDHLKFRHIGAETITAVPYDMPIIGYKTSTVNTLRLWNAEAAPYPTHKNVLQYKRETEAVSEFLYPDDTNDEGKILRLKQQYFLVAASLRSIINSYRKQYPDLSTLYQYVAIHINDTHPVLAIPELMRILVDEESIPWDEAWEITTKTISYTNHTTLSEALERWPVPIFKPLLPRIFMIVEEINERFCRELWDIYTGEWDHIERMALISHGVIRMAHLAIVGSHSINGVAKIHTEILKHREMNDFYVLFPNRFNNKTNGITHRRWLLKANPQLSTLITDSIGEKWITEPEELRRLEHFADNYSFKEQLMNVKQKRKEILASRIYNQTGLKIDTQSIFDVQVKRLHAYKRQLLNVLHIMHLYNKLKENPNYDIHPRTFIFGAKASPGYHYAKKIIKLINTVADKVNHDPVISNILKVVFIENYRVSIAEEIIPATDVSIQISTASKEASGTGNMKFMMNGALTLGTLDGANIEIGDAVGKENIYTFGLTSDEVLNYYENGGYRSTDYYHHNKPIQMVVDQLVNGFFPKTGTEFELIYDSLLVQNDEFFVLKDLLAYIPIQQEVGRGYGKKSDWYRKSTLNISKSGYFSSDRTIKEYADGIWGLSKVLVK
ncbi:glycogen/starch/alpha-glucan phosphorylase [Bacillus salitolerans]|uniref:Alpha-1,4 glucan phosphorylase n=1 Tax=Bacillus salitolerans TaxID=1437434 RepID=A0ABW4LYF5_9BACI